jgi:hypothetical protein
MLTVTLLPGVLSILPGSSYLRPFVTSHRFSQMLELSIPSGQSLVELEIPKG